MKTSCGSAYAVVLLIRNRGKYSKKWYIMGWSAIDDCKWNSYGWNRKSYNTSVNLYRSSHLIFPNHYQIWTTYTEYQMWTNVKVGISFNQSQFIFVTWCIRAFHCQIHQNCYRWSYFLKQSMSLFVCETAFCHLLI